MVVRSFPYQPFDVQYRRGKEIPLADCNVNNYLSVMKTLCIRLYRRTVETETMMNSIVYIY